MVPSGNQTWQYGNGESPMIELVIQDMTYDMLNQWTWCIRFSCLRITRYWWLNVAMEKWWLHGPITDVFSYENLVILHSYVIPPGTGTGFYPKTAVRDRENHHAFKVWSFYVFWPPPSFHHIPAVAGRNKRKAVSQTMISGWHVIMFVAWHACMGHLCPEKNKNFCWFWWFSIQGWGRKSQSWFKGWVQTKLSSRFSQQNQSIEVKKSHQPSFPA